MAPVRSATWGFLFGGSLLFGRDCKHCKILQGGSSIRGEIIICRWASIRVGGFTLGRGLRKGVGSVALCDAYVYHFPIIPATEYNAGRNVCEYNSKVCHTEIWDSRVGK